jgi:hypothetical protein
MPASLRIRLRPPSLIEHLNRARDKSAGARTDDYVIGPTWIFLTG